jgi:peroxin-3
MTLGLLPTLAEQVLDGMDVEALTRELQGRSRTAASPLPPVVHAPPPDPPLSDSTGKSERGDAPGANEREGSELAGSTPSLLSYPTHAQGLSDTSTSAIDSSMLASVDMSKSTHSWVQDFSSQNAPNPAGTPSGSTTGNSEDLSAVRYRLPCIQMDLN